MIYKSYTAYIKIVATTLTLAMLISDIAWAYPFDETFASKQASTLQVQSIFKPIRDKNISVSSMLEAEIISAARLALRGEDIQSIHRTLRK